MKNESVVVLIGRALLAFIFIVSGLSKIPSWNETLQYMSAQGIPWGPMFLFPAIFIEVIGGIGLLVGYRARLSAALLAAYLVPVTLIFHAFWSYSGMERQMQLINFMKNLAIMGGLLTVAGLGAGALSLDRWLHSRSIAKKLKMEGRSIRRVS